MNVLLPLLISFVFLFVVEPVHAMKPVKMPSYSA